MGYTELRINPMPEPYPAGYGYPAGNWQIDIPDHRPSPMTIEGFPTHEEAVRYALVFGYITR